MYERQYNKYTKLDNVILDGNYDIAVLTGRTAVSVLRLFLNGAFWALVGGLAAVITKNRYMSYAVPFILYYVLTVFQERYYQKAFFLSPRYRAAMCRRSRQKLSPF